jgi:hypothetical protein
MDFDPATELKRILGPSPKHPWEALIPQILLWCFRRFCIEKLMAAEATLSESLWDDHIELVQRYCPKGLEVASIEWMTPENIESVSSRLEEYNKFFIDFAKNIDKFIETDDFAQQDIMSEFLDSSICTTFSEWLGDSEFAIFPMNIVNDDIFTESQFRLLINSLLAYVKNSKTHAVPVKNPEPEPISLLWQFMCIPPMIPDSFIARPHVESMQIVPPCLTGVEQACEAPAADALEAPAAEALDSYEDLEAPATEGIEVSEILPPIPEAVSQNSRITVARAFAYRRTIRKSGRRLHHAKTRRYHPAL